MMCSRRPLSRALAVTALVLLNLTISYRTAPADETATVQSEATFRKGTRALQFEISYADLRTFNGAMFSGKYHLSNASALRYGIGIGASTGDNNSKSSSSIRDGSNRDFSWETAVQYVHYSAPSALVKPYWVIGARGLYNWRESRDNYETGQATRRDIWERAENWSAGFSLGFGLEWVPARQFGFFGEYRSWLYYSSYKATTSVRYDEGPWSGGNSSESSSFGFDQEGVSFGLSVYF